MRLQAYDLTGALEVAIGGDNNPVELSDVWTAFELIHLKNKSQSLKSIISQKNPFVGESVTLIRKNILVLYGVYTVYSLIQYFTVCLKE